MSQTIGTNILSAEIAGEKLNLLPEKAIWWPRKKSLLIADLHIGKVGHFRKNNIAIPSNAAEQNFHNLESLFIKWSPKKVYFLGDLFHSFYNKEWEKLIFVLAKYPKIKFILITGNHDILNDQHYTNAGIKCHLQLGLSPFMLTHHPEDHIGYYNLCGHIHPGVRLRGNAKQYMRLPCFYFTESQGILPAFGSFTGTAVIKAKSGDKVFAIFNNKVSQLATDKKGED